jgi:ribosomal protein S18 acetylase RimI-like enzyme
VVNAAQSPGSSEPVVRIGTREDASLLAELGARTFRESSPNTRREDVETYVRQNFTREKLIACLSVKNTTALILEKSAQAIGYALLSPGKAPTRSVPPQSIQIKWFYILEDWTGRKLGDVLMARCFEHASQLGIASIWLTVWKNNGRAIHFYERWGFQKVGTCDFVMGRDSQEDFVLLKNIHATWMLRRTLIA